MEDDPIEVAERRLNFFAVPGGKDEDSPTAAVVEVDGTADDTADGPADGTANEIADGTADATAEVTADVTAEDARPAPVAATLRGDCVIETACPLTPKDCLKRSGSVTGDDESPWKQMRKIGTSASSSPAPATLSTRLAGVQATKTIAEQQFAALTPLVAIWNQCLQSKTSSVLLVSWQDYVQSPVDRRTGIQTQAYHAWGLTTESNWVKVSSYGRTAVNFHNFIKATGRDYCHLKFSALRHMRKIGNSGGDAGVHSFKVEDGCKYEIDNSQYANLSQAPSPEFRTDFGDFLGVQDNSRCFILCKIHEVFGIENATVTCSERLPVQLIDMYGNLRKATVWPPTCNWEIWKPGAVVTILGCFANMSYNAWSLPSDCCVMMDSTTNSNQFPKDIISTTW